MTLLIQFAPGTLDRQSTRVSGLFDTDLNGSTGIHQTDGTGSDYSLDLVASTSLATISKADPVSCAAQLTCFNALGSMPITFVADGMQVVVHLSTLGGASGRMTFRFSAYAVATPSTVFDIMPDPNVPPGRVQ